MAGVGAAPQKALKAFRATIESLMSAAQEYDVPELIEEVLARSGYMESLEAERTIEAQGRMENLQELVSVAREWREQPKATRRSPASSRRSRSTPTRTPSAATARSSRS